MLCEERSLYEEQLHAGILGLILGVSPYRTTVAEPDRSIDVIALSAAMEEYHQRKRSFCIFVKELA
jgi:hypothetical protein